MKTTSDFSAHKLSKTQMNSISGGQAAQATFQCFVQGELVGFYKADSKEQAEAYIKKHYGSGSCSAY